MDFEAYKPYFVFVLLTIISLAVFWPAKKKVV